MRIAVVVLSICLLVVTAVAAMLWRDNALLNQQLVHSRLTTPQALASVVDSCATIVDVNKRCMAFSHRVKEMLDVEEGSTREAVWAGLWNDQVRRGTGGADQGSSRR